MRRYTCAEPRFREFMDRTPSSVSRPSLGSNLERWKQLTASPAE
jgi:hypothetical protein